MSDETSADNASEKHREVYHHGEAGNVVAATGVEDRVIEESTLKTYWRANLRLLGKLLAIWFVVSFGAGILFGKVLDNYQVFGFKLGFWFAQQGAIYVFVVLIFVYAASMHKLERKLGLDDDDHFAKKAEPTGEGEGS